MQLLAIMALGRLLTPTEFGLMGAASVVVAFSQIVSQIGVGPAIIQRQDLEPVHVRVAVTLSLVLGGLLGAAVFFGAPAIAAFYRIPELEPMLRAVAFLFPLDGLNTVAKSLLTRQLRFRLYIALDAGSYIVGLRLRGRGPGLARVRRLGAGDREPRAAGAPGGRRCISPPGTPLRPSLDLRAATGLLSFGFGHSMAQIGTLLSQQGDNMVVGRWLGAGARSGIYGRAYNLMVMPAPPSAGSSTGCCSR